MTFNQHFLLDECWSEVKWHLAARLTCYTKVLSKNMKKIATVIENENFIKQLLLNYSTRYSGYELIATISALRALLVIYHVMSNGRYWNNC